MAEIAKDGLRQNLTTIQIATFAETGPSVPAIIGWLASTCDLYVYLSSSDGTPTLHAGSPREGQLQIAVIPGEELSLCAVGEISADLLAQVALMMSTAIARQRAETVVEAKNQSDLLRSLVAGESEAIERSALLGWDLDRDVFVIVGRIDEMAIPEIADEWRRIIRQRDPKALVAYFPNEIVAVMARDSLGTKVLAEALPRADGIIGVSKSGRADSELSSLYQDCDSAITVARSIGHQSGVWSLEDLGVYQLLTLIEDSEELRKFLNDTLKDLATRSDLEAIDLRRTLQTLLDYNLNVAETSRALHFHYNTLRYRISKLEKLLGSFTEDAELRLSLSIALRLLNLHGKVTP